MVNSEELRVSRVFKALSDPTRRDILKVVARKEASAGELAAPFDISAPAISKHLKVLESAGLVTRIREGKTHRFQLNVESLKNAEKTIQRLTGFWNRRLVNLDKYLETKNPGSKPGKLTKGK
ncbi:MAG: DNA-binding transcriptional ArsR family regulator [Candidatus Pelagisphaera sp.]|jgi:DNA-binding transcriptional ArsR family regulator